MATIKANKNKHGEKIEKADLPGMEKIETAKQEDNNDHYVVIQQILFWKVVCDLDYLVSSWEFTPGQVGAVLEGLLEDGDVILDNKTVHNDTEQQILDQLDVN